MSDRIICTSHAKINWWLKVGPLRPDGYHDIETVFQELDLGETISFHRNGQNRLSLTGFPPDIQPAENLVTKSWEAMRTAFPGKVGGVDISITKTLPRGGGLGGGSSNAACTIAALNNLFEVGASLAAMQEIAGKIGSDVPFFLKGGTAIGRGRGDILEQQRPAPRYWLVLLMPVEGMSTAESYRLLDSLPRPESPAGDKTHTLADFLTKLYTTDPTVVADAVQNDFELVAQRFQWFQKARKDLINAGALGAFLCGSGSTVAGIVMDEFTGQRIAEAVQGFLTSTRYTL